MEEKIKKPIKKPFKKGCLFFNKTNKRCTHRENVDFRSRLKSGKLRRYPKECSEEFCPIKIKD